MNNYILRFLLVAKIGFSVLALKAENSLFINSIEAIQGNSFTIEVQMQNTSQIVGFQFDLGLPEGIIVNEDDVSLSTRKDDHNIVISSTSDNKYRLMSWSTSQANYTGNNGTIISIPCQMQSSLATGDYEVLLSNCILGNSSSVNIIDSYENGILTVLSSNNPPVSNAGVDQTVDELTLVTLNGSESNDPDGNEITYLWAAPAEITLNSTTVANPSFTAPEVTIDKTYTFSLVVNDGELNSTTDVVVVTVKQVNKIPVADAGTNQNVNVGDLVTLDASGSYDDDGDDLTYSWSTPSEINLNSNTNVQPAFIVPNVSVSTEFPIVLTVNDGFSNSIADTVFINVIINNQQPVANAGIDQTVNEGTLVTLNATASYDPEGDEITYLWSAPNGITLSNTTIANPTFTAPDLTSDISYQFTLAVNDGEINSQTDTVLITVLNATNSNDIINNNETLKIYPNPASNFVTIEVDPELVGEEISIYTSTGQLTSTTKLLNQTNNVDITELKCGLYTVRILNNNFSILKVEN